MLSSNVLSHTSLSLDEARQHLPAWLPGICNKKVRRNSKSTTRALLGALVIGVGDDLPPAQPPCPQSVDLRDAVPLPLTGMVVQSPFRFWVDELLWSQGRVAVELLEQVLAAAGGVRTGGTSREEQRARRRLQYQELALASPGSQLFSPEPALGSHHMASWELLWTKSTYAIPAARSMRPGQLVSAVIGLNSLTMKKRLLLTLRGALGPHMAFTLTPRSFALPEELDEWEVWLRSQQQDLPMQSEREGQEQRNGGGAYEESRRRSCGKGGRDSWAHSSSSDVCGGGGGSSDARTSSLWMLKTGQDAGKGLILLPADQALRYARQQGQQRQLAEGSNRRFQLQVAQQYIADPFLIHGRKFHLRLWVLVTAHCPLRAYLHRKGLVLFSGEPYDKAAAVTEVRATPGSANLASPASGAHSDVVATMSTVPPPPHPSHITNYARNNNSLVWAIQQLEEHLGPERFGGLWASIRAACGRAMAAAAPSLAEAHAWLAPTVEEYGFQVLGVDYLLDEQLRPWLLEFNSAPSIMVQHEDTSLRTLVYEQKYGMLRDMWEVVRGRVYCPGETGAPERRGGRGRVDVAKWEAAHAGEFEPLMPYMT